MEKFKKFKKVFEEKTKNKQNYIELDVGKEHIYIIHFLHKNGDEYFQVCPKDIETGNEVAIINNTGIHIYNRFFCEGYKLRKWFEAITI